MTDDVTKGEGMQERAAEYALGLLDPDDARAFEAMMVTDPAARDAYVYWAETFAALTDDIAPVAPPPDLERTIKTSLFGVPPRRSLRDRFGWLSGLVVGGVAVAVAAFVFIQPMVGPQAFEPEWHADLVTEDGRLFVQVGFDVDTGRWLTFRDAGDPGAGRALELWLIDGDNPPISLGTLPQTRDRVFATYDVALSALMDGGLMAISDEPLGGSPTGAPTGEILAVAPITQL